MRTLITLISLVFIGAALPIGAAADDFTLTAPISGRVVRGYDDVGRYAAGHRGVDVAGVVGEGVLAAARGTVSFAGSVAGRPTVSVDHGNGWRTTYQPVRATVVAGAAVEAGEQIGTLLSGHCDDVPCLHWGLTDGDRYADPTSYLQSSTVRLLPRGAVPVSRPSIGPAAMAGAVGGPPVSGRLTSRFGMRQHPVTGVYKLHDGVDYAAACGTPVTLPAAGTVTAAGYHGGYGYRVIVDHGGGLVTAYAHLPRISVAVGEPLTTGQAVGTVGNTGLSTGCHLHWMAWRSGTLIDPLGLLR